VRYHAVSPSLQRFLSNFAESQQNAAKAEPSHPQADNAESNDFMNLDEYEKEFDDFHEATAPVQNIASTVMDGHDKNLERKKRFANTKTLVLVRYCTECGFSFEAEKFCPHCGRKRATYSAPNA